MSSKIHYVFTSMSTLHFLLCLVLHPCWSLIVLNYFSLQILFSLHSLHHEFSGFRSHCFPSLEVLLEFWLYLMLLWRDARFSSSPLVYCQGTLLKTLLSPSRMREADPAAFRDLIRVHQVRISKLSKTWFKYKFTLFFKCFLGPY